MSLLITGAAGSVASQLRPYLRNRFGPLVLTDLVEPEALTDDETFRPASLTDRSALTHAMTGCTLALHLGGVSGEDTWDRIAPANIDGTYTFFEAAKDSGIARVIFASSNHASGFYPRTPGHRTDAPVRPDGLYGVSKAFGEAMAALYADKHGLRCLSVRIGNVAPAPIDARRLSIWLHPEDLAQICDIGFTHPDIHNQVVWGASDNMRGWWDMSALQALGYAPKHRSEDHAEQVLADNQGDTPLADTFQGGTFAAAGFDGDVERTKKH